MVASTTTRPATEPVGNGTDASAIDLGRAFIDAIARRDFRAIEALLAPDVRFRALVPRAYRKAGTATGARDWIENWFADADRFELVESRVEMVGDRLHLVYRIRLSEAGTWRMVEQNVFAGVAGARLADVALVCSGFRPLEPPAHDPVLHHESRAELRPDARLDAIGKTCATLTPDIRAAVLQLQPGQVLEILSDDPTAEDGLRSWTHLTGNELVDATSDPAESGRFYIRRGTAPRATGVTA